MSSRQEVPWVQFVSKALGYEFPTSIFGLFLLLLAIGSMVWTVFEAAGIPGSTKVLISIIAISLLIIAIMILVFRFLRWSLLFTTVKSYIRRNKLNSFIDAIQFCWVLVQVVRLP